MERKEIRGTLACLSFAAEHSGDHDLAMVLARVHIAVLDDQIHLLNEYMRGFGDAEAYDRCRSARTDRANTTTLLRERERGA